MKVNWCAAIFNVMFEYGLYGEYKIIAYWWPCESVNVMRCMRRVRKNKYELIDDRDIRHNVLGRRCDITSHTKPILLSFCLPFSCSLWIKYTFAFACIEPFEQMHQPLEYHRMHENNHKSHWNMVCNRPKCIKVGNL